MKQFDSATEYFPDRKSSHTRILSSDEYFGLDKKTPLKQILVIYKMAFYKKGMGVILHENSEKT